jgi:GNAT superfamily N-acetyltransferase
VSSRHSWTVREATPADSPGLAGLFYKVFGFEYSQTRYQWKFFENPDGNPIISVAEHGDQLVGQYALWPTRMRLGSSVVLGAQSLDTMTHPDYRGQGMFTILAEHCMKCAADRGVEMLYGFPNENSYAGFVRKLDWDCTGTIPLWIRPLHPSKHRRVPAWAGPLADLAAKVLPRGRCGPFQIRCEMPEPPLLEDMLTEWRTKKDRCRVERSIERYRWRFSNASAMQYHWISAYEHAHLRAIAVWGVDIRNGNALLAEVLGEQPAAIQSVISTAVRQAIQTGCPLFRAADSGGKIAATLRRTGFFKQGNLPLIVRKLIPKTLGANIHTHDAWDIFGADLDTF